MSGNLLGVLLLLMSSADPVTPERPAGPPAEAAPASAGPGIDDLPWNPDLHEGNLWPYKKPEVVETDYCGPPGEFWLRGDFLLWALKQQHLPPLVTAGPTGSGAIRGNPGVGTLFGGDSVGPSPYYGARFTGGVWFESEYCFGFEGTYFFLADQASKFSLISSGQPGSADVGRPFVNALTGQPAASLVSAAGAPGLVTVRIPTELQDAEGNLVWNLKRTHTIDLNVVAGFRYLDMGGTLDIVTATTPPGATTTYVGEEFAARNHFYGGQIGGRLDYRWHSLVLHFTETLALGERTTEAVLQGVTLQSTAAGARVTGLGVLVQNSNFGRHSDQAFAVVNEIGIQAGWQITDCLQAYAGYTLLYVSSVVRPGDLVDMGVNLAGGAPIRPAFAPRSTDFWANGLNVGLEVRY